MLDRPRQVLRRVGQHGEWGLIWLLRRLGVERRLTTSTLVRENQRRRLRQSMLAHDMLSHPDEGFYRARYWEWITEQLDARGVDRSGSVLDAGCGPGRLSIPLAQDIATSGGHVVGVDFVADLIQTARRRADQAGVGNVHFVESDLIEFLSGQADQVFSAALCIEVPFVVPDLEALLSQLARVLRPGGLLLASFRPRYFMVLLGAATRNWDLATTALRKGSGLLPGMGWQNWHSSDEVIAALSGAGFIEIELEGIGNCSGVEGDPLAAIARPSELSEEDLGSLATLERSLGQAHPDLGRYILAAASRPAMHDLPSG